MNRNRKMGMKGIKLSRDIELSAVFWDYPNFRDTNFLYKYLENNMRQSGYYWVLNRFLEYGRVVDALRVFGLGTISDNMEQMKLSEYARKKWQRMLEIYG